MNWMSILGLCLIVAGTVFSFFGTYFSDKRSQKDMATAMKEKNEIIDNINASNEKLVDQNLYLLNSNKDVANSNKNLTAENNHLLDTLNKYQFDVATKNKKIEQLEYEIYAVKEYSTYATADVFGRNTKSVNGIKYNSDLTERMNKILVEVNGKVFVKSGKTTLTDIDDVIKLYPDFPFGYWAKFNLLKTLGDGNCRHYAQKAIDIFKVTTSIKGHDASHDEALKALKQAVAATY